MKFPAAIDHFFFRPADARALGICRFLFIALLLVQYGGVDYGAYGNFPASFRNPIWLFQLLHVPFVSVRTMGALGVIFKLSLLAVAVGFLTRSSAWIAAIVGSYVLAIPNNFGRAGHGDDVVVILLWVFAIARSGDAFSVDSLHKVPPDPSGEYRWPIRMVWVLMSMVYLAAGVTKLRISGLHWAFSDNMAYTLRAHEVNNSQPLLHVGVIIAKHAWLVRSLAASTLVIETFFWLALFNKWARRVLVPAMFLGHVFIALVMGVMFSQFMFTYVFWLPWERLLHAGAERNRAAPAELGESIAREAGAT
ncbi:MAG: hypothetical protein JO353_11695 [Phycisphaerae bacterium]|nr:hypothetical protein [Phycisphaerae bacterium]